MAALALLAGVLPAAAAPPEVEFDEQEVLASGVTPGGQTAFWWLARGVDGFTPWTSRLSEVVVDEDGDGAVSLSYEEGVPEDSLWTVIDLTSGEYALASPAAGPLREVEPPRGLVGSLPGRGEIEDERRRLDVLVVRPGTDGEAGGWTGGAEDGGAGDGDGRRDGRTRARLERLEPLEEDGPQPPRALRTGDLVVVGDARWNRYAYAVGNPVKYLDPFGLHEEEREEDGDRAVIDGGEITVVGKAPPPWTPLPPLNSGPDGGGAGPGGAGGGDLMMQLMTPIDQSGPGVFSPESDPCSSESVLGNFLNMLNIRPAAVLRGSIGGGLGVAANVKVTAEKVTIFGGIGIVAGASLNALFGLTAGETEDGPAAKASFTGSQIPAGFSGTISGTLGDGASVFAGIGAGGGISGSLVFGELKTLHEIDLGLDPCK